MGDYGKAMPAQQFNLSKREEAGLKASYAPVRDDGFTRTPKW